MDSRSIISLLGSRAGEPGVEALFRQLGVKERPKLAKGEFDAHVEAMTKGVSLIFEDEAYLKDEDRPIGQGPLVLVGAFFYSEGHEGFTEFQGELPGNITFSDSGEDVLAKLGEPEWKEESKGMVIREGRPLGEHALVVEYARATGMVSLVTCELAEGE